MRIAFVSIPRFACAVEVLQKPSLQQQPLIVGDAEQPKRVLDCSAAAGAHGVQPGMTVRQALGNCPEAAIVPPDPVLYRMKWEAILDVLSNISPEVEDEEPGRAYVNVAGLSAHYCDDNALARHVIEAVRGVSGLDASVGLAGTKFTTCALASCSPLGEARVVPEGAEPGFLVPLDISLLPVDEAIIFRLRLFGLHTIGDVARLTVSELQSQFGFEGKRLWQLANGCDEEPLYPRAHIEKVEMSLTFEAPVAGIDVMVAASKQLLSRLRLALQGKAARELTLQAELETGRGWERRIVMKEPVSESERLAFVLRSALQNAPPPNAVRSISLRLGSLTGETGKQLSLGERARVQRHLEDAIRQLRARYGYSPVFRCVDVEPWSVIPEERQILIESDG